MEGLEIIATMLHVLSLGVVAGGYVAAVWSPFLLLGQLRPLFHLGPTDQWWTNYLVTATLIGTVHVIVLLSGAVVAGETRAPVEILFYGGIAVALLGMTVSGVVLPGLGYDWAEDDREYVTSVSLLAGSLWYAIVTIALPFVLWTMYLARS